LYCGRCRSGLCRLSSSCGRRHRCAVLFPYTTLFRSQMGTFLQARDCMGQLVGVIGMLGYDYRFPHLGLDERKTVEVARLFVDPRSEEHTSELQSRENLVCRLLLAKKKY